MASSGQTVRLAVTVAGATMLVACAGRIGPAVGVDGMPLAATTDAAVIDHGRYLVNGPGHCAACHTTEGALVAFDGQHTPPLVGGYAFDVPGGHVRTPNITMDETTGVGAWTDADIMRALRDGRRPDGAALLPFMEFQGLSDDDLVAVTSFLRSLPPAHSEIRVREINWFGRLMIRMFVRARGPATKPPPRSPAGPSVERGKYLSNHVAACASCHTRRSRTGGYKGARLSGGYRMVNEVDRSREFVTPNLTPDRQTGHIVDWTEAAFVDRFRSGRSTAGSPMPWRFYAVMTDDDLRSIYRYLKSLIPVSHDVGPVERRRN